VQNKYAQINCPPGAYLSHRQAHEYVHRPPPEPDEAIAAPPDLDDDPGPQGDDLSPPGSPYGTPRTNLRYGFRRFPQPTALFQSPEWR
jgi:hypothetical protein